MARKLRGDIRWADLNPVIGSEQGGLRPVFILSHNVFNEKSGTVIAVAITSQPQRAPLVHRTGGYAAAKKSLGKDQPDQNPFHQADRQENSTSIG